MTDWIFSNNTVIADSILNARKAGWKEYQQQAENRIAMLNGDWLDQEITWIRQLVDKDAWDQIYRNKYAFHTSINPMRDIITKVAKLYLKSPQRQFLLDGVVDDTYELVKEEFTSRLNQIMHSALQFTLSCGGCVIRPILDDRGWYFQILTPDMFTPFVNDDRPDELTGLQYTYYSRDSQNQLESKTYLIKIDGREPVYEVLDSKGNLIEQFNGDEYPFIDQDGEPYLPFALARIDNDPNELLNKAIGLDLYYSTLLCGSYSVFKEWLIRQQSHKQWILTGPGVEKLGNSVLDPSIPVVLPTASAEEIDVKLLDLTTDPSRFDNAIDKEFEREAGKRGYMLSDFVSSAQKQSADALTIQNEARDEYLESLCISFTETETCLANIMRNIYNSYSNNNNDINEEAIFNIVYSKNKNSNLLTHFDNYIKMYETGLISKTDILLLYDPNLSATEAEDIITNNELLLAGMEGDKNDEEKTGTEAGTEE